MTFEGRNTAFPAVTPTATPAFSIISSARNQEGAAPTRVMAKAKVANPVLIRLSIELPSEKKFRSDSVDAMGRVPIAPHPEVVTATLIIQIVVKTAELPILKTNTGKTCSARYRRCHDFRDNSHAPFLIANMGHLITDAEIESFCFGECLRSLRTVEVATGVESRRRFGWLGNCLAGGLSHPFISFRSRRNYELRLRIRWLATFHKALLFIASCFKFFLHRQRFNSTSCITHNHRIRV